MLHDITGEMSANLLSPLERRSEPRIRLEGATPVRLLAPRKHHEQWGNSALAEGILYDLNQRGAFILTDLVLPKGSPIAVEFATPGVVCPAPLQAVVARRASVYQGKERIVPAGLGVQFVIDTSAAYKRLFKIVMSTLILDLMDYAYQRHRSRDFWTGVLSSSRIATWEWQPPPADPQFTLPGTSPLVTVRLGAADPPGLALS